MSQNFGRGGWKHTHGTIEDRWPHLAANINSIRPDILLGQEAEGWAADGHARLTRAERDLDMDGTLTLSPTGLGPVTMYRRETLGRRTYLNHDFSAQIKQGYREPEPIQGPPGDYPTDHQWQIAVDRIVIERWDAEAAARNQEVANDLWGNVESYVDETGLELLPCPTCGNTENLIVRGAWDDPITVHCPCGDAMITHPERTEFPGNDWGRNLLKRLILTTAAPSYDARRLLHRVAKYHDQERKNQGQPWYKGPYQEDVSIAESVDLGGADLGTSLTRALQPKLPKRHGGRPLDLLLVSVALALAIPQVRDSDDGRQLQSAVKALLTHIRTEGTAARTP
ncbi:hypothetical protein [Streptomyces sp. ISL-11]|uniref:hypothetical protein n=1 Tax=Streptomyces sp. ISL-11 TaxID=2819174 RepID=UPI001BE50769|nr:hypothetical protein [Streptomyces sp. ISL-11]MBT2384976.1 hypothetical protein [Streptomyces sp. ISL-11]